MEPGDYRIPPFPLLWNPLLLPYSTALIAKLQKKYEVSCTSIMVPYPPPLFVSSFTSPQAAPQSPSSPSSSVVTGSESSEKPHHCARCGKRFALKSYLSKHEESACYRSASSAPSSEKVVCSPLAVSSLV
ncbi:zinc finger, C2H2 type [Ancylostoma duodenale]|uniref:Zinc finger, C2H2 type n=1 Tax=Ancylostoma duodenale TaxID=51022 RepID=A0A0C2GUY6_9BILA|nr:zinc finger, C2H2 type [Ancylostoma duodenale]